MSQSIKIVGVGLNKTGTKTLANCLKQWGYRHQSYDLTAFEYYRAGKIDELLAWMEDFDSFEDWPWPLIYRDIDHRFPEAKFILTVRDSPERWYRSLCKMAVRMGPLSDYEQHIYGYSMPHGRKRSHIAFYEKHNSAVDEYFNDRPGKLLRVCWEHGDDSSRLAAFLNQPRLPTKLKKINESLPVYSGDNLWLAHLNRVAFQTKGKTIRALRRLRRKIPGAGSRKQ